MKSYKATHFMSHDKPCFSIDRIVRKRLQKLSRGEICVANFITPCEWGKSDNYFLSKIHKLAVFEERTGLQKQLCQPKLQTSFQMVFGSG